MPLSPKDTPYWWEAAPVRAISEQSFPASVDIAIIGAGYTGLSAALTLARAGRDVIVFDKQLPGEGASSRNGGITSGNLRPSRAELAKRFGEDRANRIILEGTLARADLYSFIQQEIIDCDFSLTGRFIGAIGSKDYDALARDADYLTKQFGIEAYAVPKAELSRYIATDFYDGGNVRMDVGGLHPAKLHAEMLRLVLAAGASVHSRTAVEGVDSEGSGWIVKTSRGQVRAGHVIVATNGHTDTSDRWLRRRIVPVRSRIIATEELGKQRVSELMPKLMMSGDTRKLSYYYRPSPDGQRILFGGRDGSVVGAPAWPTQHLQKELARIFPDLADVGISHSWYGDVAMNRDMIPRIFTRHGMRYATGYCGSGVVWARWAGKRVALQLLGDKTGETAFDFRPPAFVPLFNGKSWFIPAVYAWLSHKDKNTLKQRR